MIMTEEEYENWQMVEYRMDNEGLEYCFKHYSSFEEIEDEEFHKLRKELLECMEKMREYVKKNLIVMKKNMKINLVVLLILSLVSCTSKIN
jgi:hypothetical protein